MVTWYTDMKAMQEDDAFLQKVYTELRHDLSPEAKKKTQHVHVYPSRQCSYTIAKERIFLKVRDETGNLVSDCVLRHVLLHELAHTINPTEGHDGSFRMWMKWIAQDGRVLSCPDRVPRDFNQCH
jgi:predicted metal-dependent hydrolase